MVYVLLISNIHLDLTLDEHQLLRLNRLSYLSVNESAGKMGNILHLNDSQVVQCCIFDRSGLGNI